MSYDIMPYGTDEPVLAVLSGDRPVFTMREDDLSYLYHDVVDIAFACMTERGAPTRIHLKERDGQWEIIAARNRDDHFSWDFTLTVWMTEPVKRIIHQYFYEDEFVGFMKALRYQFGDYNPQPLREGE